MKIYTRTGDKGETSLFGGKRISKDEPRIEAYGSVDELNSVVGVARTFVEDKRVNEILGIIQNQLFVLGADLATPSDVRSTATMRISDGDCTSLEKTIDEIEVQLEKLDSFVIPGGSRGASLLHQARTVCRRAERHIASLRKRGEISAQTLIFLNRLSDLLFVLARFENKNSGIKDHPWNPRSGSDSPA